MNKHRLSFKLWQSLWIMVFGLISGCSKQPADGPDVTVGTEGVTVSVDAGDLKQLVKKLENLKQNIEDAKKRLSVVDSAEIAGGPLPLPNPPAKTHPVKRSGPPGVPGPQTVPPLPGGSPATSFGSSKDPSGISEEIRNKIGLEVEALLNFFEDPDTPIPFKDNLSRMIDLTTSGTGQFSAKELDELEGEVQAILGEIDDMGRAADFVAGPGPRGPGPRPR